MNSLSPHSQVIMNPKARAKIIIEEFNWKDEDGGAMITHKPHPIFTELEELRVSEKTDDLEWKETAR